MLKSLLSLDIGKSNLEAALKRVNNLSFFCLIGLLVRGAVLDFGSTLIFVLAAVLLSLSLGGPYLESIERDSDALLLLDVSSSMNSEVADSLLQKARDYEDKGVGLPAVS